MGRRAEDYELVNYSGFVRFGARINEEDVRTIGAVVLGDCEESSRGHYAKLLCSTSPEDVTARADDYLIDREVKQLRDENPEMFDDMTANFFNYYGYGFMYQALEGNNRHPDKITDEVELLAGMPDFIGLVQDSMLRERSAVQQSILSLTTRFEGTDDQLLNSYIFRASEISLVAILKYSKQYVHRVSRATMSGFLAEHKILMASKKLGHQARFATPGEEKAGVDIVVNTDDKEAFLQVKAKSDQKNTEMIVKPANPKRPVAQLMVSTNAKYPQFELYKESRETLDRVIDGSYKAPVPKLRGEPIESEEISKKLRKQRFGRTRSRDLRMGW